MFFFSNYKKYSLGKNIYHKKLAQLAQAGVEYVAYDMVDEKQNDFVSSPEVLSPESSIREDKNVLWYAVVALGLALFIRFFVATPYMVSGSSMEHTFENLDYLIIDRLTYTMSDPKRGDVVVFTQPQAHSRDLIKRIVGLPGETVVIRGNEVSIINAENPDGTVLNEPYLTAENYGGINNMQVTLKENEYYVLGDNRRVSADSRMWGPLPKTDIIGRVIVRLFPFTAIQALPGQARYQSTVGNL